jgi:ABC-type nitrate/sulfonate/bicarbonate transport system ATPase subunit
MIVLGISALDKDSHATLMVDDKIVAAIGEERLTRVKMQDQLLDTWTQDKRTVMFITHDVEEAVYLANRVVVFSDRPARTVAELAVDLPYPRHRTQPRFVELRQQALRHLGLGEQVHQQCRRCAGQAV